MFDFPWYSIIGLMMVAIYCIVQAIRDARAKKYIWAVAAAASAVLLLSLPIKSHAIKIDLPAAR